MSKRLTASFEKALTFASRAHAGQLRKGSRSPYIGHPIAVASLTLDYGGTETQAIAALLHDVIEDCGVTRAQLARSFGARVARIVADCSDTAAKPGERKPPWKQRKTDYIAHLAAAARESLLVSICDKIHNARAIVHDLEHHGPRTWRKFSASPAEIVWYYESLLAAFERRRSSSLEIPMRELRKAVSQMRKRAGLK